MGLNQLYQYNLRGRTTSINVEIMKRTEAVRGAHLLKTGFEAGEEGHEQQSGVGLWGAGNSSQLMTAVISVLHFYFV